MTTVTYAATVSVSDENQPASCVFDFTIEPRQNEFVFRAFGAGGATAT